MKTIEKKFTIDCTGDACVGDIVKFEKAVFTGSYPKAKFSHMETVVGEIIKDSYGQKKQQHTFTLRLPDDSTMRIKGRNLYRNGCKRQEWDDEEKRKRTLDEKHKRGSEARRQAAVRKSYHIDGSPGWYYAVCSICGEEGDVVSEREIVPPPTCDCI